MALSLFIFDINSTATMVKISVTLVPAQPTSQYSPPLSAPCLITATVITSQELPATCDPCPLQSLVPAVSSIALNPSKTLLCGTPVPFLRPSK